MDEHLTQIETQLAFLDKNMSELSRIVFEQQKQIDFLVNSNKVMAQKLAALPDPSETTSSDHEKPPHY